MNSYDAIVIGAGLAGLSVARELAKLNQRVLLLERESQGGKASRAAAGILDPYTEANEETPLFRLGLQALDFYPSFLEQITKQASSDIEFEKLGILYLSLTEEDEKFLKDRFERQKARGLPVEFLSAGEVQKMEPCAAPRTRSGVYYPEIPKLNAEKLTSRLFEAARAARVEIRTSVKGVSVGIEKERVRGVEVSEGKIEAPAVILAAGSWADLDLKIKLRFQVKPVRGQILLLRSHSSLRPRHILHTTRLAYVVPWPRDRLLVGSTLESAGFDDRVTPEGQEDILNRASEIAEGIRTLPVESSWSGLRPYAEGGTPLVGPTLIRGLFLAAGYYRSGILVGPLLGKLLAEGIASGNFSPLLKPFYPK